MDRAALDAEVARIVSRLDRALIQEQLDVVLAEEWAALDRVRKANPKAYDHVMARVSARRTQLLRRVA